MTERVDPGDFAYGLVEHVADVEGDENAQAYLIEVLDEVMLLEPGLREHFAGALLVDLVEELMRRGSAICAKRVTEIAEHWEGERG